MEKDNTNATSKKGYTGGPLFEEESSPEVAISWDDYDPNDTVKNNQSRRIRRNRYEENIR